MAEYGRLRSGRGDPFFIFGGGPQGHGYCDGYASSIVDCPRALMPEEHGGWHGNGDVAEMEHLRRPAGNL